MENLKELSKEELAIKYQETQCESVFEELHSRFENMIYKFVHRYSSYGVIDLDELESLCRIGFYNGVMKYPRDKKLSVSSVVYRYMQSAIHSEYSYLKARGRDYMKNNSVSINHTAKVDSTALLIEAINHDNSKDIYFRDEFIEMGDAIDYALSKMKNENMKKYMLSLTLGECTEEYVAEKLGCCRQNVNQSYLRFKNRIKNHVLNDKDFKMVVV